MGMGNVNVLKRILLCCIFIMIVFCCVGCNKRQPVVVTEPYGEVTEEIYNDGMIHENNESTEKEGMKETEELVSGVAPITKEESIADPVIKNETVIQGEITFLENKTNKASDTVEESQEITDWSEAEEETTKQEEITKQGETTKQEETTTQEETTKQEETTTQEETTKQEETTTQAPELSYEEKQNLMWQQINQSMPGIVCWGDSLTFGYGGNGTSYPSTLQNLIDTRIIGGIPVINNGIPIESTYSILVRANAVPMYSYAFEIPSGCDRTEMEVVLDGGHYINLGFNGEAGLNPVTIAGVKGRLEARYTEGRYGLYYFSRLEPGEAVNVQNREQVYVDSQGKYSGYVNILFMGQNGTYSSPEHLVEQHRIFVNSRDNDRFLLIGLTTGTAEDRALIEGAMSGAFGDKYINMRHELSVRGVELAGLTPTEGDIYCTSVGLVPGSLKSDDVHLNEHGYRAMASIIYERMDMLGYFGGVRDAIQKYNN